MKLKEPERHHQAQAMKLINKVIKKNNTTTFERVAGGGGVGGNEIKLIGSVLKEDLKYISIKQLF